MKELDIQDVSKKLQWISGINKEAAEIYNEVVVQNCYSIKPNDVENSLYM